MYVQCDVFDVDTAGMYMILYDVISCVYDVYMIFMISCVYDV